MDDDEALGTLQAYNHWKEDLQRKEPDDSPAAFLQWRAFNQAAWRHTMLQSQVDTAITRLDNAIGGFELDPRCLAELQAAKLALISEALPPWV